MRITLSCQQSGQENWDERRAKLKRRRVRFIKDKMAALLMTTAMESLRDGDWLSNFRSKADRSFQWLVRTISFKKRTVSIMMTDKLPNRVLCTCAINARPVNHFGSTMCGNWPSSVDVWSRRTKAANLSPERTCHYVPSSNALDFLF